MVTLGWASGHKFTLPVKKKEDIMNIVGFFCLEEIIQRPLLTNITHYKLCNLPFATQGRTCNIMISTFLKQYDVIRHREKQNGHILAVSRHVLDS